MRLYELTDAGERTDTLPDAQVSDITDDTRKVGEGSLFIAITGKNFDGHAACGEMLKKGAAAVVVERDMGLERQIVVSNTREAYSRFCSRFYGEPQKRLKLIAATGTNGKTTTVNVIKHIMNESGHKCACIGTAGYDVCGERVYEAHLTTPYQPELYRLFREAADNGAEYCVLEASSQALSQYRLSGLHFICGIFSNLTQDHLDWHGTMENYYEAKKSLFYSCDTALINIDDPYGKRLYDELSGEKAAAYPKKVRSLSEKQLSDYSAAKITLMSGRVSYFLNDGGSRRSFKINVPMPGGFNVMNTLSAAAACIEAGTDAEVCADALNGFKGVCGRAEVLYDKDYTVICDYAHTEDALRKTLSALKPFVKGRFIVVFGAAGERDAIKRPSMGKCVSEFADIAVVTSDNPRFEEPKGIIDAVCSGFEGDCEVHSFIDRREAIEYAVSIVRAGDVMALCGKGHENYQVIGDDYMHFSEHEIIKELCG